MAFELKEKKWVIVSKDRKVMAKGNVRDRWLIPINEGNMRILTYTSKGKAESAFKNGNFFYQSSSIDERYKSEDLEAIEVEFTMTEI